jgi:hypothetical protein
VRKQINWIKSTSLGLLPLVVPESVTKINRLRGITLARRKNEESFRLFKRKLAGRELFYVRVLDVDGTIIASRSTGTSDERKAVKAALEIIKLIPKNPLKHDPLLVDALISFWHRDSEYVAIILFSRAAHNHAGGLRWGFIQHSEKTLKLKGHLAFSCFSARADESLAGLNAGGEGTLLIASAENCASP